MSCVRAWSGTAVFARLDDNRLLQRSDVGQTATLAGGRERVGHILGHHRFAVGEPGIGPQIVGPHPPIGADDTGGGRPAAGDRRWATGRGSGGWVSGREEAVDFVDEDRPGGFVFGDDVVVAVEVDQTAAGNELGEFQGL